MLMFKIYPSSSSSLCQEPGVESSYLIYWQLGATSHDLTPKCSVLEGNSPYFREIQVGEILFHLARIETEIRILGYSFHSLHI